MKRITLSAAVAAGSSHGCLPQPDEFSHSGTSRKVKPTLKTGTEKKCQEKSE